MNITFKGKGPLLAGSALLATGLVAGTASGIGRAGSHVDAPSLIADGPINGADLFAFTSPDKPDTVTLIATYNPFTVAGTYPTVGSDVEYDMNIDAAGTGKPSSTYRWTFQDTGKGSLQSYTVQRIQPGRKTETLVSAEPGEPAPGHGTEGGTTIPGGGRVFAGPAKDAFTFNLKAAVWLTQGFPIPNVPIQPTALFNAYAMGIQVPKSELALNGDARRNPAIGVYATATRRTLSVKSERDAGRVQVSRIGNPFFNEVVVANGTRESFNTLAPTDDYQTPGVKDQVLNPDYVKRIAATSGGKLIAPPTPRKDLEEVFMTGLSTRLGGPVREDLNSQLVNRDADPSRFVRSDELRLNMATPVSDPPSLNGYLDDDKQGWPNGRRPTDEVANIILRISAGELTGQDTTSIQNLNINTTPARPYNPVFPYVAAPLG